MTSHARYMHCVRQMRNDRNVYRKFMRQEQGPVLPAGRPHSRTSATTGDAASAQSPPRCRPGTAPTPWTPDPREGRAPRAPR
ncbi:hypothetical protein C8R44DRAFT_811660 [Mycena epipterygia]|nr:hypothetical protein C8R44DRAFT_811660 [Mycena epipterygia]